MTASPASLPRRLARNARSVLASFRLQLVWWFIVIFAIATIGSVLIVRQILFQRLDARIDAELTQEVREVELLATGNDPETGEPFAGQVDRIFEVALSRNVPAPSETIMTFVGGDLQGIARGEDAPSIDDLPIQTWANVVEPDRGSLVLPNGHRIEYIAVPFLVDGSPVGTFVVTIDRDLAADDTDAASLAAGAVGLVMVVVGSLLAFRLAEAIVAPVRRVRRTAQSITETDLSQRISVTGYDEVSELAQTFNDMLDRLDAAFATQRRFIDDAGHELRTPITVIQGHLDTLGDDPEERAQTLALLDDELARVRRMVDDLITLARADRPDFVRPGPTDLGDLTRTVLAKARGLGERDWRLDLVADEIIWADEQRLTQAVLQLAENATRLTDPGAVVAVGSSVAAEEVRLWVRDTGPGVPPEDQARIFDRFVRGPTSRKRAEGSGLGLSIVSAIAEAHGGWMVLDSPAGGGATFTIVFPLRRSADG